MNTDKILWDIDTQNDIILPTSNFAVPGAYKMVQQFGEAIKYFENQGVPVMGVLDAHTGKESVPGTRDENLPLHCIKGTSGQRKIKETDGDILYVSDHPYEDCALDLVVDEIKSGKRIYFEKQCQSCESNPNIAYVVKKLGVKEVYLMGVLINVCVRFSDSMFKKLGVQTYLVLDALKGVDFPGDTVADAISQMTKEGTKLFEYKKVQDGLIG